MNIRFYESLALFNSLLCENESLSCIVVVFFPKENSFLYFTFLHKLSALSLGSCPNGSTTCSSYNTRNVARYIRTGVKPWFLHLNPDTAIVLCNVWRRERRHTNVKVVEWSVALLLHGEQSLDKERNIRNTRDVFGYRLFCWNWKIITKSIIDKSKS